MQNFSIAKGDVHIWQIQLSNLAALEDRFLILLNPDELKRANRFRFALHRQSFIIARGILREILSLYTKIAPQEIDFIYGPRGKPYLKNNEFNLQFNVSHSGDMALYALSIDCEIGTDIQKIDEKCNEAVAKRFFSQQEYNELMSLAEHQRAAAFCFLWACKEALIKAVGEGLYVPLGNFSVSMKEKSQWITLSHAGRTEKYFLESFPVTDEYQAAFATQQEVKNIVKHAWKLDGPVLLR